MNLDRTFILIVVLEKMKYHNFIVYFGNLVRVDEVSQFYCSPMS